ncbi:MAG: hypothetical protein K6T65_10640 [Peptococcaceae bacterium]|nr:hypothetical protein [Peptococcaceae bacterium]
MDYKPSSKKIENQDITHIIVRYSIPYCLYLFDGNVTVVIDGKPGYITHNMITSDVIRGFPPNVCVPPISRLRYDRWGRQAFTLISVSLPRHSWPENFVPERNEKQLVSYSLQYVNKFIHCYKHVTNEFLCDELTEIDIPYYDYIVLNSTTKEYNQTTCFFPFGNSLMSGDEVAIHGIEKYNVIQNLVQNDHQFSASDELAFNANSFLLKGQYGLAVLLAAQSFEAYCKDLIKQGYLKKGNKTVKEIEQLFENCSFKNLVKDHLRLSTDFDFGITQEFTDWTNNVRPVRNSLAHGELPKLSKNDVEIIFRIINSAKNVLNQNIKN